MHSANKHFELQNLDRLMEIVDVEERNTVEIKSVVPLNMWHKCRDLLIHKMLRIFTPAKKSADGD
jgi:hypothetical protein